MHHQAQLPKSSPTTATESVNGRLRVGVVSYLNSRPLVEYLPQYLPGAVLVWDVPARLADALAAGRLHVGLVPVMEWFRHPEWQPVGNACVACRGKVLSVRLFGRVDPQHIRTLAGDVGSRTSIALAQVLLTERFGVRPQVVPLPLEAAPETSKADAVLLIGDRAIKQPPVGWEFVWDLGEEWHAWTGLPFVFAAWLAQPTVDVSRLAEAFDRARDAGVASTAELSLRYAGTVGLTVDECRRYLQEHLWFYLDHKTWEGLRLFRRLVEKHRLAENPKTRAAESPGPTGTTR